MRIVLAAVLAFAAGPALAACNTAAPQLCDPTQMKVVGLGWLGSISSGYAINDSGAVIGTYETNTGDAFNPIWVGGSFEWTQAGGMVALPDNFRPVDINAAGEIAGDSWVSVPVKNGTMDYATAVTMTNGVVSTLLTPNEVAKGASVTEINKAGAVLGKIGGVPTIWTKGRPASIPGLPAGATNLGMNDNGEIVGTAPGGGFTLIGGKLTYVVPGGRLAAVNDKGNATGSSVNVPTPATGPGIVVRDINGVERASKPLAICTYSEGYAINSANMIVGECSIGHNGNNHSFLMEPTGAAFDLTALYGFTASYGPHSINSSGWIVGTVGSRAVVLVWK